MATSPAVRYGAALLGVLASGLLRAVLDPWLGDLQPLFTFFLPVLLLGWCGAPGPASFAAVLGWLAGDWFFLTPRGSIFHGGMAEIMASLVFLGACALLIAVTCQMRRARQRAETIFRSITDAFFAIDREWRATYVNPAAERLLRRPASELLGRNVWEVFREAEGFRRRYEAAVASGQAVHFEEFYAPLEAWFEVHAYPNAEGLSIYFRDTTERKQVELALRLSEERFRTLADNMSQCAWMADGQGSIFWYNQRWYEFTGTTWAEMQGWGWQQVHHPDHVQRVVEKFRAHVRVGQMWEDTFPLRGRDGQYRWFLSRAMPIRDAQGQVVQWFGTNTDITEQRRAEEALAQSEQRYRSFVEASAQVIWRTNARGEVDQAIPSWCAYTGQNEPAAAGLGWMHAIHPDDRQRVSVAWEKASRNRGLYEVEYRLRRHDGQWRRILARGVPVLQDSGQVREYIGTCIDVTEPRQAQETLRWQARLIDLAPAANIVRTLEGGIRFWSAGAEKLYGWTRAEAVGRTTQELLQTEYPVDQEAVRAKLRGGGSWSGELRHRTKDGRAVVVESHWLGQFTPEGHLVELLESNMDVTERKHTEEELRRLKDQLEVRVRERTAELEAANKELEAFGYSVSHDLRAPLRHIDSYGKLLEKHIGAKLDEQSRRHLRIVLEAVKRMGHLLDDLLVLSRLGRASMEERPVSLRRLMDEARQELAPCMTGRSIEWRVGALPRVLGDANLLRSALSNLLSNAIKYSRSRSPAVIEVGSRQQDGEVVCFVRDNGAGFDMKFADQLFGVFQRLHTLREFEGTGIGLASVRRVIQRHGGRTWAEGAVDQGASFYFSLPLHRVTNQSE